MSQHSPLFHELVPALHFPAFVHAFWHAGSAVFPACAEDPPLAGFATAAVRAVHPLTIEPVYLGSCDFLLQYSFE